MTIDWINAIILAILTIVGVMGVVLWLAGRERE